jgi:flagellar basal-body rod modification protein FlgD
MSSISAAASVDNALNGPVNRFSELSSEDFLQIIFTELTNQDPLAPNDTNALLEQLNSIRSIESDLQITKQLEALVTENQLASAGGLLGKYVEGLSDDFDRVSGMAVSIIRSGDDIQLELDSGIRVSFGNIDTVADLSVLPAPSNGG